MHQLLVSKFDAYYRTANSGISSRHIATVGWQECINWTFFIVSSLLGDIQSKNKSNTDNFVVVLGTTLGNLNDTGGISDVK